MAKKKERPRLLVFIVAYYAESTLQEVLERIPPHTFEAYDCEVLIIDDGSKDRTFTIGCEYRKLHPDKKVTVLRNQYNQGYGGNQKIGYEYAIAERFEFVVLLHGDAQYAPEELPRLIAPLAEGTADAVLGSRMMERGRALRGGMPLYKYVGNVVLTTIQNRLLKTNLSEFHSGYRAYSVRALERIHFRLNTNDFHFDTEILIQLFNSGARVKELPIPTYYGDELCRVNGLRYAKDVVVATLKNVAHRSGVLHQRRFEPKSETNEHYGGLKLGYASSHSFALDAVPPGASVVDIGCGPEGLAPLLKAKGCRAALVDQHLPKDTPPGIDVHVQDLDQELTFPAGEYEYLLLLDVIEHLKDPELFMERLRARFDHRRRVLVLTTANVAFIVQRLMLLGGQFNYGKAGILDRTHTRLFTFRSIRQLVRDAGFELKVVRGIPAPFPKVVGHGLLGKSAIAVSSALIRISPELFAYQIYVEAVSTPSVAFLLEDAKRASATLAREPTRDVPVTPLHARAQR